MASDVNVNSTSKTMAREYPSEAQSEGRRWWQSGCEALLPKPSMTGLWAWFGPLWCSILAPTLSRTMSGSARLFHATRKPPD